MPLTRRSMIYSGLALALRRQKIDEAVKLIQSRVDSGDVRAASLHVRCGKEVFQQGFGAAKSPRAVFLLASISKPMTASAVMLLSDRGKLSIDDDIRKYLPEIRDYGTPITIRNLLTHTSGLRDQWELLSLARGRFEEDRITEADVMDIVPRQTALNFTPGAEYVYSNTGFTLLGVIVKRVSGKSLRDFADERIFKPLGMTSTHFHDDYTMLVPGRTSAYAPRGSGWRVSKRSENGDAFMTPTPLFCR